MQILVSLLLADSIRLPFGKGRVFHRDIKTRSEFIREALLWSDPVEHIKTWEDSRRGSGCHFGAKITKAFLSKNNLDVCTLVEAHATRVS